VIDYPCLVAPSFHVADPRPSCAIEFPVFSKRESFNE
jgi:hypothetical protein